MFVLFLKFISVGSWSAKCSMYFRKLSYRNFGNVTLSWSRSYFTSFLHFRMAVELHIPPANRASRPTDTWVR